MTDRYAATAATLHGVRSAPERDGARATRPNIAPKLRPAPQAVHRTRTTSVAAKSLANELSDSPCSSWVVASPADTTLASSSDAPQLSQVNTLSRARTSDR